MNIYKKHQNKFQQILFGIVILLSDEHSENDSAHILCNDDGCSISSSLLKSESAFSPIISTSPPIVKI